MRGLQLEFRIRTHCSYALISVFLFFLRFTSVFERLALNFIHQWKWGDGSQHPPHLKLESVVEGQNPQTLWEQLKLTVIKSRKWNSFCKQGILFFQYCHLMLARILFLNPVDLIDSFLLCSRESGMPRFVPMSSVLSPRESLLRRSSR